MCDFTAHLDAIRATGARVARADRLASADVVGHGAARGRQWAAWNAKKVIRAAGGSVYLAVREIIFEHAHGRHV